MRFETATDSTGAAGSRPIPLGGVTASGGPDAATTAVRFLQALGRRDFAELESLLAPDVWMRALLPRKLREGGTAEEAVEAFRSWYGGAPELQVLELEHDTMANRELLRYRFRLRPDWAPDQWHEIEQVGYCRVTDGRISRIDLSCTGFHPTEDPDPRQAGEARQ